MSRATRRRNSNDADPEDKIAIAAIALGSLGIVDALIVAVAAHARSPDVNCQCAPE